MNDLPAHLHFVDIVGVQDVHVQHDEEKWETTAVHFSPVSPQFGFLDLITIRG